MCAILKYSSAVRGFKRFIRRAGRPGSTAVRMPAATENAPECANVNMNCHFIPV